MPYLWSKTFILPCILILTVRAGSAQPQEVPEFLRDALNEKMPVTLFSIYPEADSDSEQFMGYPVLGRVELDSKDANTVVRAVLKGITQADPSLQQSCFAPRHGLTFSGVKLLICYACHSVIAESKEKKRSSLAITDAGHEELVQQVLDHDLPWQGWQPAQGVMRHQSGLSVTVPDGYQAEGAAGTDTLSLQSHKLSLQQSPLPGALVLQNEDGTTQTVSTKWLDHSSTGKIIWYLVGSPSTYDPEANTRTSRGTTYQLNQVRAQLLEADKPAELRTRLKVRPLVDEGDLETQHHRLRRAGFSLGDTTVAGVDFKVARRWKDGVELKVAVGLVPTEHGPVLVTAEIPLDRPDPLSDVVLELVGKDGSF